MKKIFYIACYQLLIFIRMKEAVFFTVALPSMLFILFGYIFAIKGDYVSFFLAGVIGSAFASEGLYGVGPMIKGYYTSSFIKYMKNWPVNILVPFIAILLSRIIIILLIVGILSLLAFWIFDYLINLKDALLFSVGSIIGLVVYSMIGLLISFYGFKNDKEKALTGLVFFMTIFLSDSFFPISKVNDVFLKLVHIFPITYILAFMRGSLFDMVFAVIWLVFFIYLFYFVFKKYQFKR